MEIVKISKQTVVIQLEQNVAGTGKMQKMFWFIFVVRQKHQDIIRQIKFTMILNSFKLSVLITSQFQS